MIIVHKACGHFLFVGKGIIVYLCSQVHINIHKIKNNEESDIGGGTDAEKMLRLTFALLDNDKDGFMNADVLWVTDFLIPRTTEELMSRFPEYRKTGTRFYGFQIGEGENNWENYFDHIYRIHYVRPRMY